MPAPAAPTARIEVFRPGTFRPMEGEPITYSAADLRAIADAYDPETAPAPIVVGHPDTDAPAFGWVERFDYDPQAGRLYADLHEIEPAFAELVKAGRFKKVSMAFFSPGQGHNPVPGSWYPKHVGFLGAAAPAVSGLANARFSGAAGVVFTAAFGDRSQEEAASLFRALREFLIDRFGLEDADRTLPSWQIEWLSEAARADPEPDPAFSAPADPAPTPTPDPKKEPAVDKQPDPAFADRDAALTTRELALAEREKKLARAANAAFAEKLVEEGRLLPASLDQVVALLDGLASAEAVSFAEGGEKVPAAQALRDLLAAQPKAVAFGALDLPDDAGDARPAAFAADGKSVDPEGLKLHQKAVEFQRANPGTAYLDAVRAVS